MATIKRIQEWHEIDDRPDADLLVLVICADESQLFASTDGEGNWFNEDGEELNSNTFRYWADPTSPLSPEAAE